MMSALALSDIAVLVGGRVTGQAHVDHVCTDTRALQPNSLFVALQGENFDGNRFAVQAVNDGAAAAVVSRSPECAIPHVLVDDTRQALALIARENRRQFSGPVVALTGSAGKTTCKEMIASILAECGQVLATKGNLNNEIGVPLTLLTIDSHHQYAVIEMGASRPGDIQYLMQFAEPAVALVTNAMPAHMASFGSLDAIVKTKGEIFEYLSADGIAVVNFDDPAAAQWRQQSASQKIIYFSQSNSSADIYARHIQQRECGEVSFTLCTTDAEVAISLPLLGEHNIANAVAAAAAAIAVGADLNQVKKGLQSVEAVAGRLKVIRLSALTVIDDSYNASPGSVTAAIDVLATFPGKRCLLLGTMAELGADAERLHGEVAAYARDKGIEQLILVGEYAKGMAKIFGPMASSFDILENLLPVLSQQLTADVVLVKGSRFTRMERVVDMLVSSSENNRGEQ